MEPLKRVATFKVNTRKAINYYLQLTKPMHKLSNKQVMLLSEILITYVEEKDNFKREQDVWKFIFSGDNRHAIRQKLNMTKQVFENYLTQFRKNKIIVNNSINPKYNPGIVKGIKDYELVFKFNIVDE